MTGSKLAWMFTGIIHCNLHNQTITLNQPSPPKERRSFLKVKGCFSKTHVYCFIPETTQFTGLNIQ